MEGYSGHIRLNGMSIEHGLVPVVATNGQHVGRSSDTKCLLQTLGDTRVIA